MAKRTARIGDVKVGSDRLFLIAGPCVIESQDLCLRVADRMKALADRLGLPYVFKASYDKANRTSLASFRGPGPEEGLRILAEVRRRVGVPVLTDVHAIDQVAAAAGATWTGSCTSESTGTPICRRTAASHASPSSSPGPR